MSVAEENLEAPVSVDTTGISSGTSSSAEWACVRRTDFFVVDETPADVAAMAESSSSTVDALPQEDTPATEAFEPALVDVATSVVEAN